jgi:dTDP-4-amino-4,6-dideoxygalactose transaminase
MNFILGIAKLNNPKVTEDAAVVAFEDEKANLAKLEPAARPIRKPVMSIVTPDFMRRNKINAVFHYVPLHSSPAGMRFGRAHGELSLTTSLSQRLIRLPMWFGLSEAQQQRVVDVLSVFLRR